MSAAYTRRLPHACWAACMFMRTPHAARVLTIMQTSYPRHLDSAANQRACELSVGPSQLFPAKCSSETRSNLWQTQRYKWQVKFNASDRNVWF